MVFDSHAHLDDKRFQADRQEVIDRAWTQGLSGILNAGADMESSARAVEYAERYTNIYAAVGIHPHDAKEARETDYARLAEWACHPKVVAIGEIGLDYYYNFSPKEVQQTVCIRQIDVARQTGKPIILHDRDAHGDILDIIKKEARGLTGVFHCFSGSLEMAREVIKLGFYVSFAGPVTYKNSVKLQEIAAVVPLDRILVETDCPYLTPEPYRGRRNEPAHVKLIADVIAGLRGMEPEALYQATTENVYRLFGIAK